MGVVGSYENVLERSATGAIRQRSQYSRSFTVRVDTPNTSLVDIGNAPGIAYGDPHPDDSSVYVTEINVQASGDSMLLYRVTYTYTIIDDENVSGGAVEAKKADDTGGTAPPPDPTAVPLPFWSGSSSLNQINKWVMKNGAVVVNSAGVPYPEGVLVDRPTGQLVLTAPYPISALDTVIEMTRYVGYLNTDNWPASSAVGGSERGWWKFTNASWAFKEQTSGAIRLPYVEAVYTLSYKVGTAYDDSTMNIVGGTDLPGLLDQGLVSPWVPWITSKGYSQMSGGKRVPIEQDIVYKKCDGTVIAPGDLPDAGVNMPCEYPTTEPVSEPMPLKKNGTVCQVGENPGIQIINTSIGDFSFHNAFGSPYQ